MRHLAAVLVLGAFPSAALADELTLRNGSTFTGAVREQGDQVSIETEFGSMTFKKIDIKSVRSSRDPVSVLEEKLRAALSVKDLMAVADWARENDLRSRANRLYEQVILREPDHAGARTALGYEFIGGRWLHDDELLAAYGLVKVDGRWMEKDEADRILAQRETERIRAERLELAARIAAQRREEESATQALEQEQIRVEPVEAEQPVAAPQELLRRDYFYQRQWWRSRWHDNDYSPAPPVVQVPPPAPRQVLRITTQESRDRNAVLPPSRDRSPVPLTPPTVIPLTPPSVIPIPRSTTPLPVGEEKKK